VVPDGSLVPTFDTASARGMWIQALDSSQHVLEVFGGIMDTDIDLIYPGKASCPRSCSSNRHDLNLGVGVGDDGSILAHELGHAIQKQEFDTDDLRNECGGSHTLVSVEADSCATAEGFADYVAAVSWYEPNDTATVPFAFGYNLETNTLTNSVCVLNRGIELQAVKAFWDMDDFHNEGGVGGSYGSNDHDSWSSTDIAMGWRQFPHGTGDGEDFETGDDGVNMWDYYNNNVARLDANGTFSETFIAHNCLESQDPY
jgi:hypothetical protein